MGDGNDSITKELLKRIDASERGKLPLKIKTLMSDFGYRAGLRVRQSSLDAVLADLEATGIDYTFPSGSASANDYITLSKKDRVSSTRNPPKALEPKANAASSSEPVRPGVDPLSFAFKFDDGRFGETCDDLFAAVWATHPVCLVVEASDEFLTLAGGVLGAVMRRRASMFATGQSWETLPVGPTFLSIDTLRRSVGRSDGIGESFPRLGAVYVVRDQEQDVQIDELSAFVREALIPHTYRLAARYPSTSEASANNPDQFRQVLRWLSGYAGASSLADTLSAAPRRLGEFELASLLAEASQIKDVRLERCASQAPDKDFRAGYESAEHMVLKNVLAQHLRGRFPGETVSIEKGVDIPEADGQPSTEKARPDLKVGSRLWVEVETLREVTLRGSNPFFSLASKLIRKADAMRECDECWLLVPSDLALLATTQLLGVTKNLGIDRIKFGYVDLERQQPIFLDEQVPERAGVRVHGTPWRSTARPPDLKPITLDDVAGYAEFKRRIEEDVVHPLVEPTLYRDHGLSGANGLLLYGLPGCGKSLMGRALAGRAELPCRMIVPSDLTSKWLGEGVEKIRELFDWALRQPCCLLVIDELDGIAPQRSEHDMHSDEKRQVNELLTQLDRVAGKSVTVVATTNYLRGVDSAIRRSGRFDIKIPVFPPTAGDRSEIFGHYLRRYGVLDRSGKEGVDTQQLAAESRLFTPSDIRTVVEMAVRRAIRVANGTPIRVTTDDVMAYVRRQPRSIQPDDGRRWLEEAEFELPPSEELSHLRKEIFDVFGAGNGDAESAGD